MKIDCSELENVIRNLSTMDLYEAIYLATDELSERMKKVQRENKGLKVKIEGEIKNEKK